MKKRLNILSMHKLCTDLKYSQDLVVYLAQNMDKYCRIVQIQTKSGKEREVVVASEEVKCIQRRILCMLNSVYTHNASHGWRKGRSTKTNAQSHCGNNAVICFDIKDCFPSIHSSRVRRCFEEDLGCSPVVSNYLTRLTTFNFQLPQGFSTSGCLVNILLRDLDSVLAGIARKYSLVYTRYGDDMTFSGRYISKKMREHVVGAINNCGLSLNDKKENYTNGATTVLVTGLNTRCSYPKVPRYFKKKLRAEIHLLNNNLSLAPQEIQSSIKSIFGKESYISYIEKHS